MRCVIKNKIGFTLIELLAVIVILAIILVIAAPSIINTINNARINSFNASSDMLDRAARTYASANNISVAEGTTTVIHYDDIKTAGYINKVLDPISNNECIHSRVYITNTGGNYNYTGALVCDNYMDVDIYNLVTNGNFSNGMTGWTLATSGASIDNGAGINSSACGKVVYNGVTPSILGQNINIVNGHKYYGYGWFKRVGNLGIGSSNQFDVSDITPEMDFVSLNNNTLSQENTWYKVTNVATAQVNGLGMIRFFTVTASTTIYGDNIIAFDLTAIYGAGNEPTTTQMNNIMINMGK